MESVNGNIVNLKAGDLIKNNDPRYAWITAIERIVVEAGKDAYAVLHPTGAYRVCKVRLDRIFTDGKHHAQGYTYVPQAPACVPPPAGVRVVGFEDAALLHNEIARAVGEGMPDREHDTRYAMGATD